MRTHRAGELRAEHAGEQVTLAGWVARHRDHGGVLFVDIRDASGIAQVVIDPEQHPEAATLRMEFAVEVSGQVRSRPEGTANPDLPSGEVEVAAEELTILSPAEPLPFMVWEREEVDERTRLQYRYLDLRRPRMAENLRARSEMIRAIRDVLFERGFLEIETPTLVRSTPEGARDLLVPSRLRQGRFYALPQSPQLYKQLLMISGVERYFQIARCYRDEDFRSDRQVEFTQLDLEGSFWEEEGVQETIEAVIAEVVRRLRNTDLQLPLPRITYAEAVARYGTDKPDLRFGMEIADLTEAFEGTEFRVFADVLADGGTIRGFNRGPLGLSRAGLDDLVERAKELGAGGLIWAEVTEDGIRSPVAKALTPEEQYSVAEGLGATTGDQLMLVADRADVTASVLGQLRLDLGQPDGHEELEFAWVTDFPVFDVNEAGELVPSHHPFTAPADISEMRKDPSNAVSRAYDLVVNGVELGSGSVRIHDPETQSAVFDILGIGREEAESRFGWFLEALRYGTPPHAGFAVGLDRLLAVLRQEKSIREVIPFPKTQTGMDPLTDTPDRVGDDQLEELGLDLRPAVRRALEEEE
ncbi:MAG: aspartate--tRNA ligase [Acidimicrobiia bacterium]